MKKIISALFVAGGIAASFGAHAVTITSGSPITTAECAVLSEQVTLNLSKDVLGAYSCDEATNSSRIATCHKSGSRKPTTVNCTAQGEPPVPTPTGCTLGEEVEISNYRGFTAVSTGGGVGTEDLGSNCTQAAVEAILPEVE